MIHETWTLVLACVTGFVLGAMFFGGLRWTVTKGVLSTQPALWFFGSLWLRTSLTLVGFSIIARRHWEELLVCLLGFVVAHLLVTRFTGGAADRPTSLASEGSHAS